MFAVYGVSYKQIISDVGKSGSTPGTVFTASENMSTYLDIGLQIGSGQGNLDNFSIYIKDASGAIKKTIIENGSCNHNFGQQFSIGLSKGDSIYYGPVYFTPYKNGNTYSVVVKIYYSSEST